MIAGCVLAVLLLILTTVSEKNTNSNSAIPDHGTVSTSPELQWPVRSVVPDLHAKEFLQIMRHGIVRITTDDFQRR